MKKPSTSLSTLGPILLIVMGGLIILIILINQIIGSAPSSQASNNPAETATQVQATVVAIQRVSLVDARLAFDQKNAVFMDVRDPDSYAAGNIPGALNIPLSELDARSSALDAAKWIITYCT